MIYYAALERIMGFNKMPKDGSREARVNGSEDLRRLMAHKSESRLSDLSVSLDSSNETSKLAAMRSIIEMTARGVDVSSIFSKVVNNVVSKNPEIRKLVYLYLMRYAEENQELALLPVSSFQKTLKVSDPAVRANAIRVMSSIRVPIVLPVVLLCLNDAVGDLCPYVRRSVANAIVKLYSQDVHQGDRLVPMMRQLLNDNCTFVVGGALLAFDALYPQSVELFHGHYRRVCTMLTELDEWSQLVALKILLRYACENFPEITSENMQDMDSDHWLLISSVKPLLQSSNCAVVCAAAELLFYAGPPTTLPDVATALIHLLISGCREVTSAVLRILIPMAKLNKQLFRPYISCFFVYAADSYSIQRNKLHLLTLLACDSNVATIAEELQSLTCSTKSRLGILAARAMGRLCLMFPSSSKLCLPTLLDLLSHPEAAVCSESIVVLKSLLQKDPVQCAGIMDRFVKIMDKVQMPEAVATILWLIGEFAGHMSDIATFVLRRMLKKWDVQDVRVKSQVIGLAAKIFILNPSHDNGVVLEYSLELASSDENFDLRDRSDFLRSMILRSKLFSVLNENAKQILFCPKLIADAAGGGIDGCDQYRINSLSNYISSKAPGYVNLPKRPGRALNGDARNVPTTSSERITAGDLAEKYFDLTRDDKTDVSQSTEGPDDTDIDVSSIGSEMETGANEASVSAKAASCSGDNTSEEVDGTHSDIGSGEECRSQDAELADEHDSSGSLPRSDEAQVSSTVSEVSTSNESGQLIDLESAQLEPDLPGSSLALDYAGIAGIFHDETGEGISATDTECLRWINVFPDLRESTESLLVHYAELKPENGCCRTLIRARTTEAAPNRRLTLIAGDGECGLEQPDGSLIVRFQPEQDDRTYLKALAVKTLNGMSGDGVEAAMDSVESFSIEVKLGPRSFIQPEFVSESKFCEIKAQLSGMCAHSREIAIALVSSSYSDYQSLVVDITRRIGFGIVSVDSALGLRLCGVTILQRNLVLLTVRLTESGKNLIVSLNVNCELPLFPVLVLDEVELTIRECLSKNIR